MSQHPNKNEKKTNLTLPSPFFIFIFHVTLQVPCFHYKEGGGEGGGEGRGGGANSFNITVQQNRTDAEANFEAICPGLNVLKSVFGPNNCRYEQALLRYSVRGLS